jgi:hypothetical protein
VWVGVGVGGCVALLLIIVRSACFHTILLVYTTTYLFDPFFYDVFFIRTRTANSHVHGPM